MSKYTEKDIMVDLETMSTSPRAAIVSIGAVRFGPNGVVSKFSENVTVESCVEIGLEVDESTKEWWSKQSKEAQEATFTGGRPVQEVIREFSKWVYEGGKGNRIWGNGAAFDNVILKSAYEACGLRPVWGYNNDRCYRTFKGVFSHIKMDERKGTHHKAVDDAESQALHLIKIMNELYGQGVVK